MSDASEPGVLYTDYAALAAPTPAAALWSYRSHTRERGRSSVTMNPDGSREYWLHRSDPLLNTILPGAHVSVIVNFGGEWASGRSLPTSALVPRVCVMGPFTQPRLLRVGRQVRAVGAVLSPMLTTRILGVPAAQLVDQTVSLEEFWGRAEVEELLESLSHLGAPGCVAALRDRLLARVDVTSRDSLEAHVSRLIQRRAGVSIDQVARSVGLSRQQLARRFRAEAGLSPKVFARVARFQRLVQVLLATDVSDWASVSSAVGFYDQAHMVNEFRAFAGAPPTVFFQPHDSTIVPAAGPLRGRPSEWACWSEGRCPSHPAGTAVATQGGVMTTWPWRHAASRKARQALSLAFHTPYSALGLLVAASVVGAACYNQVVVTSLPDRSQIQGIGTMPQATTLLDANDQRAFTIYREQRLDVPLSRISPHLVQAIVAIEDQRFYDHKGIDFVRVAGAAISNLRHGTRAQGGSTLTQQLARQSFLSPEKTYTRKLKEVVLARRIEQEFSKNEILELYLNKVYFGAGLYGAEAAALGYFGKPAADLDLAQAALLAGLVKSPSSYAPTTDLARATARRNLVLTVMRDSGIITGEQHHKAMRERVALDDSLRRAEGYGQYFKEAVRLELIERFGYERVYNGGLRVYTTIDLEMQKAAEAQVERSLKEIEARQAARRRKGAAAPAAPLQAALVAMDPQTGEVRALVGGRDFRTSSFDRARQAKRQAGSAFKPFVYAAAIEAGYSPASLITNLDVPIETPQGAWTPEDEHLETPSMTMRTALRTSSNRAAVHMLDDVGIPAAVTLAKSMGVGDVPSVPSLALGAGDVTLMSMTAAYGAFANQGLLPVPTLIRRVETASGEVLYQHTASPQRVVSESTAFLMTTMLADVVNSGTAWPARRVGFTLPAAGKTGTTNDYRDAWFVGFTPHLVSGVWIGYDQPRTIMAGGYAAELAVPLWGRFMMQATKGNASDWYQPPLAVTTATICRLSGKLATRECAGEGANVYTDYFVDGHAPTEYCEVHGSHIGRGVLGTLAAVLGGGSGDPLPPPPQARVATLSTAPPPSVAGSEPAAVAPAASEAPKKKRGFWSRVFGNK